MSETPEDAATVPPAAAVAMAGILSASADLTVTPAGAPEDGADG